jgi:hypothetical protein
LDKATPNAPSKEEKIQAIGYVLSNPGASVRCFVLPGGPATIDDVAELTVDHDFVGSTVLNVFGARDDDARRSIDIGPT